MSDDPVVLSKSGGVARLLLNRPDRLNAMTRPMMTQLKDHLLNLQDDKEVRAILLTGEGRGFCAGQDLEEREVMATDNTPHEIAVTLDHHIHPVIEIMQYCPKPIVVAVNGVAAGAGMSLALAGDIVLAAKSAKFIQAFVKIGLCPDGGSSWLLTRLIGPGPARALMMTGDPLAAERAEQLGMIWKACEEGALLGEAEALAGALAAGPPLALASIKKLMRDDSDHGLSRQLARESAQQQALAGSSDFAEGVAAFKEKRPPKFTGT